MSFLPFITIPIRFAIAAFLILMILPFMIVYVAFQPREGWKDFVFLLIDGRDFVIDGKHDRLVVQDEE